MSNFAMNAARTLLIDDLKNGMIIGEDVVNRFGNVLIIAGTKITELQRMQDYLRDHKIPSVRIKQEETFFDDTIDYFDLEDDPVIREIQYVADFREEFNQIKDNLQNEFQAILKGEGIKKENINSNIEKTLQVFKGNMNVFQLIEKIKDIDDITYAHSHNVTLISYALGQWLGLKPVELQNLTIGAMLLDIGKMQVSPDVLNKQEKLTSDELDECRKHVLYSYELIKDFDALDNNIKQTILLHHERMDGSGYPMGFKGDKIPLFARIVAIADVYNALTSSRPYREKRTPFDAIRILETEYVNKLDTKILYIFLRRIGNCFVGQKVKLNDGRRAEIVFLPKQYLYKPIVKIIPSGEMVDLLDARNENLFIEDFE